MLKKRVSPLDGAHHVFLCCGSDDEINLNNGRRCFNCCGFCICPDALDKISTTSRTSKAEKAGKSTSDKFADAVCLIQDSPFRILRVSKRRFEIVGFQH